MMIKKENDYSFGKTIREMRLERNLPLKYVAAKLHVSDSFYVNVEKERKIVSKETMEYLISFYNLSEEEAETLRTLYYQSRCKLSGFVKIPLSNLSPKKQELAIRFGAAVCDLDDTTCEEILQLLCEEG